MQCDHIRGCSGFEREVQGFCWNAARGVRAASYSHVMINKAVGFAEFVN